MHSLGFSSQKTQESISHSEVTKDTAIIESYLRKVRSLLSPIKERSRVVCMDVMGFWNSGVVRHSYALRSGYICFSPFKYKHLFTTTLFQRGQPKVEGSKRVWKDLIYTAICADGTVLPPVIFTSDPSLKDETFAPGIVVHVPKIKGESNYSTQAWFDKIQEYMIDEPILFMDNHFSHHNPAFVEVIEGYDITRVYLPIPCSALCSPLDNSFHSLLRRLYLAKKRTTHVEMIKAMIEAYYQISAKNIKSYWHHVGIFSKERPSVVAARLLADGYRSISVRDIKEMYMVFLAWKGKMQGLRGKARSRAADMWLVKAGLEGVRWKVVAGQC
jgi:hypothetical protein